MDVVGDALRSSEGRLASTSMAKGCEGAIEAIAGEQLRLARGYSERGRAMACREDGPLTAVGWTAGADMFPDM